MLASKMRMHRRRPYTRQFRRRCVSLRTLTSLPILRRVDRIGIFLTSNKSLLSVEKTSQHDWKRVPTVPSTASRSKANEPSSKTIASHEALCPCTSSGEERQRKPHGGAD